ncbi:hypothetical protein AAVH_02928 [Aphelenchoides avenae]|nr:hypothetical protein AAVH_02928 [Aphelenchus avenae]
MTRVSINEICGQFAWETWTEREIADLEAFQEFMKQPAELLRVISSDDQETISMVFPTVQALIQHFKKGLNSESISELARSLYDAFIAHFDFILKSGSPDSDPIYIVSCLLDRKTSWLMTEKERALAASALVEILSAGRQADEDALACTSVSVASADMPSSNGSSTQFVFDSPFGDFARERLSEKSDGSGATSKERAEVDRYIREHATVVVPNSFSSIQFWSANQW